MKKLKLLFIVYITALIIDLPSGFAATLGDQNLEQAKQNTSAFTRFFSAETLLNLVFAVVVMILSIVIARIVSAKLTSFLERNGSEGGGSEEMAGMLSRTVNITFLFIGGSASLSILGVDLGIFMGGIGFGLGFTLKTFLTNFVGGITMVTQGFYHNGDLVEVRGKKGKIVKINSLFTSMEQLDGVIFYIPNVIFMEEVISNFKTNDKRRTEIELLVDYDTDIVKTKKTILKVIESFPNILNAPHPDILVDKLDNSGIKLLIRFWMHTDDDYIQLKSNVTETLNLACKQSAIKIPYPHMTLVQKEKIS
ncbi:mechanosensitive ion channel family protein [Candidatus Gracilibacteria bacterium 28_42_T64]|nr:mechanosensitive ion channel family protein [Candidatus Gracilibacteria bacterium 28_42_T64]